MKKGRVLRAIRGMNDILPGEARSWHHVERAFRRRAELAGFGEVRTPIIEDTELFTHQVGETSDIVEKEMYSFERHGDRLTVRPEGTAGAARAFVEHGVANTQPISKWYYVGPMFRGERPARGRYRQFYQAGLELYGDPGPICDAEVIDLVVRFFRDLKIGGLMVHVNSLGGAGTRERYREALVAHFTPKKDSLSEDSLRRLEKNPLRILDSKDPKDKEASEGAPSILDVLDEEDRAHFDRVCGALEALGVPFVRDPKLVRGLDYYTRTLFEVKTTEGDLGSQNTLAGGGRYDDMIENLGGPRVPCFGFGIGLERVLLAMPAEAVEKAKPPVVVAALSERAIPAALTLGAAIRDRGLVTEVEARDARMRSVIKRAENLGARFLAILGDDELDKQVVQLKDLAARTQDAVPLGEAAEAIATRSIAVDGAIG